MPNGLRILPGFLADSAAATLVGIVSAALADAPAFVPTMPRTGKPFSVRMTNLGSLGWVSDATGYRYQPHHPETDRAWPPIPVELMSLWGEVSGYCHPPEACLVNLYDAGARMGLHVDADEAAMTAPVVSISLGDTALFRIGGPKRSDPTCSFRIASGDVIVLGGEARRAYHGIDRIMPGTSRLLPGGGRINLTLRRVSLPDASGKTSC